MGKDRVVIFKPFPLAAGQKIRIASGPRSGDWLVIGISEKKYTSGARYRGRRSIGTISVIRLKPAATRSGPRKTDGAGRRLP